MPLLSAVEDLDRLLPVRTTRRKSTSATIASLDAECDAATAIDFVTATSTIKAAIEVLTGAAVTARSTSPLETTPQPSAELSTPTPTLVKDAPQVPNVVVDSEESKDTV